MPDEPIKVWRKGRTLWSIGDRLLPVVSGGDGDADVIDVEEMNAQRGRLFTRMDDLRTTAQNEGRQLTEEERGEFQQALTEADTLTRSIAAANARTADDALFGAMDARRGETLAPFNVNLQRSSARDGERDLDALYWATADTVPAGGYDKAGTWRAWANGNATVPVEQITYRNAGSDDLHDAIRITDIGGEHRRNVRRMQSLVADAVLFGLMTDKAARSAADGYHVARRHRAFRERLEGAFRALDVDTAGEGLEWVPTGLGATMHERVRASGRIAGLFARINPPTNPWKWPLEGGDATAFRVPEPTADAATKVTASTPGTGVATFDAEIFGGRILVSRTLEQDSALAIMPYLRSKLVRAFVNAEERAILDGDTDGAHMDSDVGASTTDARTAWDGLRKRGLANANSDGAGAALSPALLHAGRALTGKYGMNPADLVFIVSVSSGYDLLTDTNVLTVDKMGPNATILNGQLASIYGIPIIGSEWVREDLTTAGIYDGVTMTRTYALVVNRGEWVIGQRMGLDIEVDDSIYRETFQRVLVGFMREDFQNINATGASEDDTAIVRNVLP